MYHEPTLFEADWDEGSNQHDDTEIKSTLLYYSQHEFKEFKQLAKRAIEQHNKENRFTDGNLSDIILTILRKNYGKPS